MRALLLALGISLSMGAAAADRTYAVMSLVGDGLLVVEHRATTGTSIEGGIRQFIKMSDPVFDRAALLAIDSAVRRAEPAARTVLLGGREPDVLEAQSRALGSDGATQAVFDALRSHLPSTDATRLILVTKSRHPARIRLGASYVGSGSLEGLGYYIDATLGTARGDTGQVGTGLLAPFAYIDVALIDLGSGKVIREEPVYVTRSISQARSETLSVWEALPAAQKMRLLQSLLANELARAVPDVLDPP